MRRLLALLAAALAVVAIAGCGKSKPPIKLPADTHWIGDRVWVPYGQARAMAAVICNDYEGGEWGYAPWQHIPLQDGELLICEDGVRER